MPAPKTADNFGRSGAEHPQASRSGSIFAGLLESGANFYFRKARQLMSYPISICWFCLLLLVTGCAEGPLWQSGRYSPWARNKWAEEEKIADTLFARKQRMTESVESVLGAPVEQQQTVAKELGEIVRRDPVLLLRLHGVKLSGKLKCPAAIQTLEDASRDYNTDIRVAAIKAWEKMPDDVAIAQLQEMIGSDTNIDVRLAATRALGNFSGVKAVQALSLALNDTDPALQLRAAESLQKTTGESLGRDVIAWQDYVSRFTNANTENAAGSANKASVADQVERINVSLSLLKFN